MPVLGGFDMSERPTTFAEELRKLRMDEGYTQAQLAKHAGITAAYVSQLETGKRRPNQRVIRKLSSALQVHPNRLFKTIHMVEMDLASTLATRRDAVRAILPTLPSEQLEELANYLTYLEFKIFALG